MKSLLVFLKNSGIFLLGSVLSKMVAFLMLPLYTALIPPTDFGYFDLSVLIVSLVGDVIFMDIWVVLLRKMYSEKVDPMRPMIPTLVSMGISTVVYLLLAVGAWVVWDPPHLWLIILFGFLQNIAAVYKYACRGLRKNLDFAVSGVLSAAVNASSNLLFLLVFRWDYTSLYWAMIAGFLSEILYIEWRAGVLLRLVGLTWTPRVWALTGSMLIIAFPLGINAAVYWMVNSVNRVIVTHYDGFGLAGIYAVAMRFGAILMIVIMAMTFAWQDLAFSRSAKDSPFFSRAASLYLAALIGGVSALLPVIGVGFSYVVSAEYGQVYEFIPLALCVSAASGFSNFLVNIFYAIERSIDTLYAMLVAAVVNTAMVWPLVHRLSITGALLSTIIAFAAGIVFMLNRLRREIGLCFQPSYAAVALVVLATFSAAYLYAGHAVNLLLSLAVCGVVVVGALVLLKKRGMGAPE